MDDLVKKEAQEQAEQAYVLFWKFLKWFSILVLVGFLLLIRCNFGVET